MKSILPIFALSLASSACASANEPVETVFPIYEAQTADEAEDTRHARYDIVVTSGPGIPGSPGAEFYVTDYKTVLQSIVDNCKLGRTVLVQATDGISVLTIMNNDLSNKQIACIRESEKAGISFRDRGTNG